MYLKTEQTIASSLNVRGFIKRGNAKYSRSFLTQGASKVSKKFRKLRLLRQPMVKSRKNSGILSQIQNRTTVSGDGILNVYNNIFILKHKDISLCYTNLMCRKRRFLKGVGCLFKTHDSLKTGIVFLLRNNAKPFDFT